MLNSVNKMLISIGNYLFKWRDKLFPLMMLMLVVVRPAQGSVFGIDENLLDVIGILTMIAGEALRIGVVGLEYIKRGGLNKKVYAEDLVTGGFFTVCRNPLYVGNILISVGALFMHAQPVLMVVGIGVTLFVYTAIVAAEEHYLRDKFGAAYEAYCHDVNRWVPNLMRLPAAASGMAFNFRRVFAKEYTTMAGLAFGIVVLQSYEHYIAFGGILPVTWVAVAVIAIFTLVVRVLKKASWLKP
jgi:protein-S-isoprenylcysteine O-methyltransferase Ste14